MINNIIKKIQNNHHTLHRSWSIMSHHHQITSLKGHLKPKDGGRRIIPQFSPLRNASANLSQYKHPGIIIFIIFDCRNSNTKDADENRKRRYLKAWLIFAGILLTIIILAAMIISIYLLIITTKGTTSMIFLIFLYA